MGVSARLGAWVSVWIFWGAVGPAADANAAELGESAISEIRDGLIHDPDRPTTGARLASELAAPDLAIDLAPRLSLSLGGSLDPVTDLATAGGARELQLEQLHMTFSSNDVTVTGGKFTPNFGIAWRTPSDAYGSEVKDAPYELTDRIGLGLAFKTNAGPAGNLVFSTSTFFQDNTFLHRTIGSDSEDGVRTVADGGVSNTETLSSFVVAVDGKGIRRLPGFRYHLAFMTQRGGIGSTADERGVAMAGEQSLKLSEGLKLDTLVEVVALRDVDGVAAQDRSITTVGVKAAWRGWQLWGSFRQTATEAPDGTDTAERKSRLTLGYKFDSGLSIEAVVTADHTEEGIKRAMDVNARYIVKF